MSVHDRLTDASDHRDVMILDSNIRDDVYWSNHDDACWSTYTADTWHVNDIYHCCSYAPYWNNNHYDHVLWMIS